MIRGTLGMGLQNQRLAAAGAPAGPATRVSITAIRADGFSALDSIPITYDPINDKQYVVASRQGYTAAGVLTNVVENIIIMKRLREAHPNQASNSANGVVLSDRLSAGDVIAGVTNSSTQAAPLINAHFLNRDLERVTSASPIYVARLAVAHELARNGKPVQAVKFIATDGTNTVETLVNTMESTQYPASGYYVPHFAGYLDFSTLIQGAAVTVDAEIYPWVGAAFKISIHADAYPSPNLTTLRVLNDRTGAYGTAYACVDPVAGVDASGVTSTNRATAVASPYLTLAAAVAAVKAFNNTNLGRNSTDGGVVLLKAGTTVFSASIATSGSNTTWPLTIEAENPALVSTTILQDRGTSLIGGCPGRLVIRNLTVKRGATGSIIFLDAGAASLAYTTMLAFENCVFDDGGFGAYAGWIYKISRVYLTNCSGADAGQAAGSAASQNKCVKIVGCSGIWACSTAAFAILGSKLRSAGEGFIAQAVTAARAAGVGQMLGWSTLTTTADGVKGVLTTTPINARGFTVVGSVIEQTGGDTGPVVSISADGDLNAVANAQIICSTCVGARTNFLYQDAGTATIQKSGAVRFSVFEKFNIKTDVFGANANLIGNWGPAHHVGFRANTYLKGGSNGNPPGAGQWVGELAELGNTQGTDISPVAANWADDGSFYGSGLGYGDYRPQAGHNLALIPAGLAPYPIDLRGSAIPNDGTGVAGAMQP